ncbi:tyrosine-type recombinase/integrase [Lysinibacillus sp. NPDC048646]|uniref:tyrosine-type recombinase/integrase n=1 Tax=Lysinibacillus sp. NPDC048646 TaxID=3390574 RepID=UPI003D07B729
MNFVQPIRDPDVIEEIELFLKEKNERDYILFLLGIYTGLRISDILSLKVKDLKDKKYLVINEKKTRRKKNNGRSIELNPILKKALKKYLKDRPNHEYVIKSRVGNNKSITRERAYMILREVANEFDIDSLACHSMRKTLGFHLYQQTKDIVLVQKTLNHEDSSYTLRYIGIEQDTVNSKIATLKYY